MEKQASILQRWRAHKNRKTEVYEWLCSLKRNTADAEKGADMIQKQCWDGDLKRNRMPSWHEKN